MALLEPIRQPFQIDGESGEALNWLCIAVSGHGDENLSRADIDSGGVRLDHRQADSLLRCLGMTTPFLPRRAGPDRAKR